MTIPRMTMSKLNLKLEHAYLYLLRGLALLVIIKATMYWVHLLQLPLIRIYALPDVAKIATAQAIFAAIYPVISIGLWMAASWGVILWLLTALLEAAAFFFHFVAFSANPHITAMDCGLIILFILYNIFLARSHGTS